MMKRLLAATLCLPLGLLVAGASLLLVFVTYFMCQTFWQMEEVLTRWATQHGFRIIRREPRLFFHFTNCCPRHAAWRCRRPGPGTSAG